MERRLAAVLMADVAGYSRLMGSDEVRTVSDLKALCRELLIPEIVERSGRLVSLKGDGALVEFASAVAAVECAVAIQQGLSERNREVPSSQRMELRIGLNLDEVLDLEGDIFGDGVNIAARLETFAEPGSICISEAVFNQVRNRTPYAFVDCGLQHFKNIAEPVRVFRLDPCAGSTIGCAAATGTHELLPTLRKPSIAVLPFANLSGDPAQDYLVEGLRLGIQATLVHASGLFLIAPAGVSRYRSGSNLVEQVGRELGVRYVLEGRMRCIGRRIRVSVELTDVVGRQVLWAERYERPLDDGFEVEDDIVAEVLRALDVELASGVRHRSLHSLESVDLFYRGLSHFYLGTKADNAAAREAFAELTELQSDSPTGPAYVCFTHWNDAVRGWTDEREQSMALAEHWARRAVALWGNNGLAHIVLASVHLLNRRHDEALAECSRAVQLRPNCATANCYLGTVLGYCGRAAEAITKVREAIRIAPACPPWYVTSLAMVYRDSGALEDAIAAAEKALSTAAGDRDLTIVLCSAYALAGQLERARRMANHIISADPSFCVTRFAETQPYREQATTDRLIAALKGAGLPE